MLYGGPMKRILLAWAILLALSSNSSAQQAIEISPGMVITKSVRVVPKVYLVPAPPSLDSSVIVIRGDDITVDFSGATLRGTSQNADPDEGAGLAIRVEGGRNITIRNARVHGYKIALLARGTRNLRLFDNDFSHNWKPRLFSGIEHESLIDWLSHHHNERDEWLRFGAGAYLIDVRRGEIRGNRIEYGMEGLMLTRTDSMRIWNNFIQFNSGVGIGLYRSSDNVIMHNYASFNVRGYSHGFYRRGQDSADLLMYEQSSRNVVAYNSMTHGGDGLFLWAGQTTMDTGAGGANDNLFFANDFSYAPTNAMEATFSRNVFVRNRAVGSEHGLWGGYSFDSHIAANEFADNRNGISIEHGQGNRILNNTFRRDSTAINLWAIPEQPSDWGYPKHRDTRSRDYEIAGNVFENNRVGLRIANTNPARFGVNSANRVDSLIVVRDSMTRLFRTGDAATSGKVINVHPLVGGLDPAKDPMAKMNRAAIIVDEWGPYDWKSPKLWPVDSAYRTPLPLRVLGARGKWRVLLVRGVANTTKSANDDVVTVTPFPGRENDWSITLADSVGRYFSYSRFQPIALWQLAFYTRSDSVPETLITKRSEARLDYMWYRPPAGLPQANYVIRGTSSVTLEPGEYTLRTISDDAVRVWVDDQLVIDNWTPHESLVDTAPITAGQHALRVEYYQKDGWMELRVEIVRGVQRSTGSPGPH